MSEHDGDDLGIDLLMNPRRKSSDAMSLKSSHSQDSDGYKSKENVFKFIDDDAESQKSLKSKAKDEWMLSDDDDKSSIRSVKKSANKKAEPLQKDDAYWTRKPKSESESIMMKRELLYEFERLRVKGLRLPRIMTLDTPLEEMQGEYMRVKKDRELDAGVMFQRQMLMTCVSGIEFLSSNVSIFDCKLKGWSQNVNENILSYDEILEELYIKYRGNNSMAPELRLLMAIGGSAAMFSMQNRFVDMAENMMRGEGPSNSSNSNGTNMFGSIFSMFGNMFGQGQPQQPQQGQQPQQPQYPRQQQRPGASYEPSTPMRGPTMNVEEVLRGMQQNAFQQDDPGQRIEIISNVSESDVPDDISIVSGPMPIRKGKRTLHISDI
jgi:hypothetical protein